ncbi:LGFP repeat-containing protein [Arthrobacter mobilis]|uniref:LGFP repeat-containing protein n=1 Tax=Arthrobacter mobilis TaxID=2724944 RepID=A0A7X6HC96_9MICC|nr:hypothetical protein [Arthrobacter mobilis]NKX53669.1 hypothetical protein [Arthrobacter mobilis]
MTAIDDKWREIPWVGAPVDTGAGSAEMALPDGRGRARDFEHATIVWSPQTGAHEVHGDIRIKWAQLGGTRGFLGYPLTDETGCPDGVGRFNHFEGGSIYWTPRTRAHEVHGAIRSHWASLGWERSALRYPVSDERDIPGGRMSQFEGGRIDWTPAGGPVVRKTVPID